MRFFFLQVADQYLRLSFSIVDYRLHEISLVLLFFFFGLKSICIAIDDVVIVSWVDLSR